MTNFQGYKFAAAVAVGCALMGGKAEAAEKSSSPSVQVELFAAEVPSTNLPLLPVFLKYRITNHSDSRVSIPPPFVRAFSPADHPFRVYVREGKTAPQKRQFQSTGFTVPHEDLIRKHTTSVDAHSSRTYDLILGSDPYDVVRTKTGSRLVSRKLENKAESAIFWKPGTYWVQISIKSWYSFGGRSFSLELESNELAVEIAEPQGQNRNVYDLLLGAEWPLQLCHPTFFFHSSPETKIIVTRYPESAYYSYAKYVHALELTSQTKLTPQGTFQSGPLAGLQILSELSEDTSFPCADLATYYLSRGISVRSDWIREKLGEIKRNQGEEAYRAAAVFGSRKYREIEALPQIKRAAQYGRKSWELMKRLLPPNKLKSLTRESQISDEVEKMLFYRYYIASRWL